MSDPALSPTFSERPTDEDRLRYRLQQITPLTNEAIDDLVAAGVTLPPEPEPPQRRPGEFYVFPGTDSTEDSLLVAVAPNGRGVFGNVVADATTHTTPGLFQRIARLLNLDESVKDDVCSGLHEAYPALVDDYREAAHDKAALAARVKELEGELAGFDEWSNSLTSGISESWGDGGAQESVISTYLAEMERRMDAAGVSREPWADPESLAQVCIDDDDDECKVALGCELGAGHDGRCIDALGRTVVAQVRSDEVPLCGTCRDTGLVPATGNGPDGPDPCPDCGPEADAGPRLADPTGLPTLHPDSAAAKAAVRSDEAQPLMNGPWPKEQGTATVAMEDVLGDEAQPSDALPLIDCAALEPDPTDPSRERGCVRPPGHEGSHQGYTFNGKAFYWGGPDEDDAQPAEPLFTGKFLGVWSAGTTPGYPHARIVIDTADEQGKAAALSHDQEVDVYARGARPATRAITADDVAIARARSRAFESTWPQDMADALNARLADTEAEA